MKKYEEQLLSDGERLLRELKRKKVLFVEELKQRNQLLWELSKSHKGQYACRKQSPCGWLFVLLSRSYLNRKNKIKAIKKQRKENGK